MTASAQMAETLRVFRQMHSTSMVNQWPKARAMLYSWQRGS